MTLYDSSLVWFRRDLRSFDHAALHTALAQSRRVYCAFVFDHDILAPLPRSDRRVGFIHGSVVELDTELRKLGSSLLVRYAGAVETVATLARQLQVDCVFANRDYEPDAIARDAAVESLLHEQGRRLLLCKDQVVFEKDEVLSRAGKPFSVFTPYKKAWLRKLAEVSDSDEEAIPLRSYPIDAYRDRLAPPPAQLDGPIPSLAQLGFDYSQSSVADFPSGMAGGQAMLDDFLPRMADYDRTRDFPALSGTSRLSVHLRFGTVSIRRLVRRAFDAMRSGHGAGGAQVWLSELIWRDFFFMILHQHPHVVHRAFKPAYDAVVWERGDEAKRLFEAWCKGQTGYPLVDAAMHQLNRTGYMHNRLRMVTSSFLIKDLGIDWRWGERYFARQLNDYDLAANNGGWQWAASCGCDAQPYFRIFNPVTQSQRFDPDGKFIRRFLPQLAGLDTKHIHAPWRAPETSLREAGITLGRHYPLPVVEHEAARDRTLQRYAVVKASQDVQSNGVDAQDSD